MANKTKDSPSEDVTVADEVEATETVTDASAESAGLKLSDITSAVQIIDVCTKRGAFNGDELADVGSVRNRLQTFVIASQPKPEA